MSMTTISEIMKAHFLGLDVGKKLNTGVLFWFHILRICYDWSSGTGLNGS